MSALLERLEARHLLASVAGNVFDDTNNNRVKDAGEANLAGRTVYVDQNDNKKLDAAEPKATTDASGNYKIGNLAAGNHIVRQVLPAGWLQTSPSGGLGIHVVLAANQSATGRNFGARRSTPPPPPPPVGGSISGSAFDDVNNDRIKNAGEAGLSGRTVYVDSNDNKKLDAAEPKAVTGTSGSFKISNLLAGKHIVRQVLPSGWAQTTPSGGLGLHVTLAANQSATGKNLGARRSTTPSTSASIAGTVFNDANANGTRDAGEAGVPRAIVYADPPGAGDLLSVTTDASGNYKFTGLAAGNYALNADLSVVAGIWDHTSPGDFEILPVQLSAGQNATGRNLGARNSAASISGTVFNDLDGDGVRDAGEPGLVSRLVYVEPGADFNAGTYTDANGNYKLDAVPEGSYTLKIESMSGWTRTTPAGTGGVALTVTGGQVITGKNFGFKAKPAGTRTISGWVIDDRDKDGKRDPDESGRVGAVVFLDLDRSGDLGNFEPSITIGASGNYSFTGLAADSYLVTIEPDFSLTYFTTASEYEASVVAGNASGKNFAIAAAGLGGRVWVDTDGDNVKDASETALGGWIVYNDTNNNATYDPRERAYRTDDQGFFNMLIVADTGFEFFHIRVAPQAGYTLLPEVGGWTDIIRTDGKPRYYNGLGQLNFRFAIA